MDSHKKKLRSIMIALALLCTLIQCTSEDPEVEPEQCDCQSATVAERKDVEAVVVLIAGNQAPGGNQGPDKYVLSTEPKDFERAEYSIGDNILVPCDSLPTQYQKARTKVIVSYKRKKCYGAITDPTLRSNYGYYVDLTSIGIKP